MLYLIGEEEINYIFDNHVSSVNELAQRAIKTYKSRPGFFTPYRNGRELAGELIAPVVYPSAGAVTAGYAMLVAAATSVVCIGSLLVTAGAALCCANKFRDEAFDFTCMALQFMGIALVTAAVSALLAIISLPHSLASIVTRSVATLVSLGSDDSKKASSEQGMNQEEIELEEYQSSFENRGLLTNF